MDIRAIMMTSSTTSGKKIFFEIQETTRNTTPKIVCQYLVPVPRNLWQKLLVKKTDLNQIFFIVRPQLSTQNTFFSRIIPKCLGNKLGCVVRMVVDSILPHAECGLNDHRKDAPPFSKLWILYWEDIIKRNGIDLW